MPGSFWRRVKYWLVSHREQAGIDEEMRLHLALRRERLEHAGMNKADAASTAQRGFGNQLQLRETSREMWINRWFDDFLRDVQIGSRGLARNPAFTAVAVLTIALALGANTAIFSVIHTILLKPLPYPDAERILQISRVTKEGERLTGLPGAKFLYIRDHATAFRSVAAMDIAAAGFSFTNSGDPERISGSRISAEMFETLGVAPVLGRVFTAAEDRPGSEDVAVVSASLWQRRLGGGPSVLGSSIILNGRPHTVVGVMPRGFLARGSVSNEEVWIPLRMTFEPTDVANGYLLLGRLEDRVSPQSANAQLVQVSSSMRREFPDLDNDRTHLDATPYRQFLVGDVKPALLMLAGAVGLVLLLACANVANLLLARAAGRQKEIAIRTSMGASGWRLLRQLLTESLLLSALASVAGLLLAWLGMRALLNGLPESIPWSGDISFDAPVFAFTFGLAIVTGLLFGIAPAWPGSPIRIADTLKAASGRATSGVSAARLRSGLVGVEVAVSVVLLVGGALLMQSFVRLRGVSMGFDPSKVLTAKMSLQKHSSTASMMAFLDPLLDRLNASPGVVSASTITSLPLELEPQWEFEVDGRPDFSVDCLIHAMSPRYLETMGIRLTAGRTFTARDNAASSPVVIVNEAFARQAFKPGNAIGQRVRLIKQAAVLFQETGAREIVGVVANAHEQGLREDPSPAAYIPQAQMPNAFGQIINHFLPISLAVKTQGSPAQAAQTVKQIVLSVDPLQPVADIRPMEEVVDRSTNRDRFNLTLMGIFAFVALVLASIGIYGVVSYAVSQRTQEIGVRIALGASVTDVLRLVIGGGMFTSIVGVAVGLVGAYALSQFLAQLLFSTKAADPMTFAFVAALMLAVAFLANLVPALRATRVDPIRALRYE